MSAALLERERLRFGRTDVVAAAVVLALFTTLGVIAAVGLRPPATAPASGARFVPADASRSFGTFSEGSSRADAMVENSLLGGDVISTFSTAMLRAMATPPGTRAVDASWWRESVVVGTFLNPSPRYRVRSISADGIRLHGQDWGSRGVTFEPALLELPADVTPGASWRTTGAALAAPNTLLLAFSNVSTAGEPANVEDAAAGCLDVRSTTQFRPSASGSASNGWSWSETNLWCPSRGVVQSTGIFRGTRLSVSRVKDVAFGGLSTADLTAPTAESRDPATWRSGALRVDTGDDTFGADTEEVETSGEFITVDGTDTVHLATGSFRDLSRLTPLRSGTLWAHGWSRPGGQVTSLTSQGALVVVTTSQRMLLGYDFVGRLRWSVRLDDVPVSAPKVLDGARLLVTTVGGEVELRSALDGSSIWRTRLAGSITTPLATDGRTALVATGDWQVTAIDLRSGDQLWHRNTDAAAPQGLAVTDGVAVIQQWDHLTARDIHTGALRWERTGIGDTNELRAVDDQLLVLGGVDTQAFAAFDGTTLWQRRGRLVDAAAYGNHTILLDQSGVEVVDEHGRVLAHWVLATAPGPRSRLYPGSGHLWVLGHRDFHLVGDWIGPRAPGSRS